MYGTQANTATRHAMLIAFLKGKESMGGCGWFQGEISILEFWDRSRDERNVEAGRFGV